MTCRSWCRFETDSAQRHSLLSQCLIKRAGFDCSRRLFRSSFQILLILQATVLLTMLPNYLPPFMPPPPQIQLVPVTELRSPKYPKVLTRRPYGRRRPDLWPPLPSQSDTSKESSSTSSLRASRPAVPADVPRWPPVSGSPHQELTPLSERLESQCLATQQSHIAKETSSDSSPAAPSESSSHVDTSSVNCGNNRPKTTHG